VRFAPLALCALLLAAPARADDPAPAAERLGYAFEYPRILAQQRLFGIAHAVSLLAAACLDVPASSSAVQDAYAPWRARQEPAIDAAVADLGIYYLGATAVPATWDTLAQTMQLPEKLAYAAGSPALKAACATLPQALAQPRYDLAQRYRLEELMARATAAFEVEARDGYCRQQLPAELLAVHDGRYQVWREINAPLQKEAAAVLAREWPADAPDATFADWAARVRRETRVRGSREDCVDFSESLKRPEAALRNVFRMPPTRAEDQE
jgi:hypothetical protein